MVKKLLTLIASLIIVPTIAFGAAKNYTSVFADGEEEDTTLPEKEFKYAQSGSKEDGFIYRTYLTSELSPVMVKAFKAPAGFTVKLKFEDNSLDYLMNEMEKLDLDNGPAIMPAYYYHCFGSRVFVDGGYFTGNNTEENKEQFRQDIEGLTLFSVEDLTSTIELQFEMDIEFATEWGDAVFKIVSDVYTFEPYKEHDFVQISAFYYQAEGGNDIRVDIRGQEIEGFFTEDNYYYPNKTNPDGFELDENYEMTIMANGIPLGNLYVEMSFPTTPFEVVARLRFKSHGVQYVYYSETMLVADPCADILVDGYPDRDEIQVNSKHTFSLGIQNFDQSEIYGYAVIEALPAHLEEGNYEVVWDKESFTGAKEGVIYYIPSDSEIAAHKVENDINVPAQGYYATWGKSPWQDTYDFNVYSVTLVDYENSGRENLFEDDGSYLADDDYPNLAGFRNDSSLPLTGKWYLTYQAYFSDYNKSFYLESYENKFIKVVDSEEVTDVIALDVSDTVNLVAGGGSIAIQASVLTERTDEVKYYYSYELNREGVVEISQSEDGLFTVNPISNGVVKLKILVECRYYDAIEKEITIHVLDTVFDVSKLEVPNEFHYAGKDLTAKVSVRGFTNIMNLEIEWTVLDKNDEPLPEDKYQVNDDATMTIPKAERNNYKIIASYQDIELDRVEVEVRKINVNQLIRTNIWWIFLLTIGFVVLIFFMRNLLSRGKTTVESIERVYSVYCACISDDKLTLEELKRIKKEITKCLHRCEDLNIEALNQYEKAIRYLRKSLNDSKTLLAQWETVTPEDKSVFYERLDKDLSKALNVAKEIENAKELIEQYHNKANRRNYEVLEDDSSNKEKKK